MRSERIDRPTWLLVGGALLMLLLGIQGCASTQNGDLDPLEILGSETLDCTLRDAGYFFIPTDRSGRVYPSLSARIRSMGYDGSSEVRVRKRTESGDGWQRDIIEGYEGVGLRYSDPACRYRANRRGRRDVG